MTHTRTHVYISFANPHLRCDQCGAPVNGWHDPSKCGCDTLTVNVPCYCHSGATSACPSWSPVDGCQCHEVPGTVDHPAVLREAAEDAAAAARPDDTTGATP